MFINKRMGSNVSLAEFLADDSPWDEHLVKRVFDHADAYNSPYTRKMLRYHRERFEARGDLGPLMALAEQPE
jgi:hypothetical protein